MAASGAFSKITVQKVNHEIPGFSLHKMNTLDKRLLHYSKPKQHKSTLLDMIRLQSRNLQDLTDLKQAGHGDFIQGVITGIDKVANGVASEAGNLWHILTKNAGRAINDTAKLADGIVEDINAFFKSPGGFFGIFLLIGELGIVAYLWFNNRWANRPPPIPPRLYRSGDRGENVNEQIAML